MGSAVAVTRFGAPPEQDFFAELVAGAPGAPATAGSGMARWVTIGRSTGLFNPSSAHPSFETGTLSGGPEKLGAAVAASNVLPYQPFGSQTVGLGEEVIVGAPGTEGGSNGSIHLFATRITTSLIGTDRSAYDWYEYGSLSGTSAESRFGEAIAVWPDTVMPNVSQWFAVGAPGADKVFLIGRTSFGGFSSPVSIQEIDATTVGVPLGSDFGAALAIENFDGDDYLDLGVGVDDLFAVVQPAGGSGALCGASPYSGGIPHRWGAAVAVGNVIPRDVYGQTSSDAARVEEVIVGAPGADRSTWTSGSGGYTAASSASATGQVAVLQGIYEDGPLLPDGSPVAEELRPRTDLSSGPVGAEYGASLIVADLQGTGHPDIVAGAPGWSPSGSSDEYGAVQLLNSDSVDGFDTVEGGLFQATDSDDRLVDAVVFGSGSRTLLSTGDQVFFLEYVKPDGSVCKLLGQEVNALFGLNLNVEHALGDGVSTTFDDLILDTSTGELVGSHEQSTGKPLRFDLIVSDDNFDTSALDQVSVTLSNVRHRIAGDQWAPIHESGPRPGLDKQCVIRNGPTFTMPRVRTWSASCE